MKKVQSKYIMIGWFIIVLLILTPFPSRFSLSLCGYEVGEGVCSTTDISMKGVLWKLNYLFFQDKIKGKIVVQQGKSEKTVIGMNDPIHKLDDKVSISSTLYYDREENGHVGFIMWFNTDFDKIFTATTKNNRAYVWCDKLDEVQNVYDFFEDNINSYFIREESTAYFREPSL